MNEETVARAVRARSFGSAAGQYDAFRPGPPPEAVEWILPDRVGTVVDLGAGTGALTRLLVGRAESVIAVEPDSSMRAVLESRVPEADVREGTGEHLPVADASVDAIVASSSWHWIDPVAGLAEAGRVLVPGGAMAALWTGPDPDGAFIQQAAAVLTADGPAGSALQDTVSNTRDPIALVLEVPDGVPFPPPQHERFPYVLALTADQLVGLLSTISWVIVMEPDARRAVLDTARRLLGDAMGIEGDVTAQVEFLCDVYLTRRS